MRPKTLFLLFSTFLMACKTVKPQSPSVKNAHALYPTTSYLAIKLDTFRRLPTNPYILEFKNGKKHIVFCGVNHLVDKSDTLNPLYIGIEKKFFQFKPDISVNEGGDVSKKSYKSKYDALLKGGEIGLLKVLSDSLRIPIINGDAETAFEFSEMLHTYTKGELLAYIVTERLMWGLKDDNFKNKTALEQRFNNFIDNYIIHRGGVVLSDTERSFDFFKTNYEKLLNRP